MIHPLKTLTFVTTTQMNLENILPYKISELQEDKILNDLTCIENLKSSDIEVGGNSSVPRRSSRRDDKDSPQRFRCRTQRAFYCTMLWLWSMMYFIFKIAKKISFKSSHHKKGVCEMRAVLISLIINLVMMYTYIKTPF